MSISTTRRARTAHRCDMNLEYSACNGRIEPREVYRRIVVFPSDNIDLGDRPQVLNECARCLDSSLITTDAEKQARYDEQDAVGHRYEERWRNHLGSGYRLT